MLKKVTLPKNINFLKESEFDFVDDKTNNPLDGVKFTMNKSPIKGDEKNIYYIIDDGGLFVKIKWFLRIFTLFKLLNTSKTIRKMV